MTRQTTTPLEHRSLAVVNSPLTFFTVAVEENELVLDAPYQRGSVWTLDQRIGLVRSWLTGVPIPAVILNDRREGGWGTFEVAVVDGRQRVEAALAWLGDGFAVPASWFPSENVLESEDTDDGRYVRFSGLARSEQLGFKRRASLPVATARLGTLREEAELYLLINGGGTSHTEMDMARAEQHTH